MDLVAVTPRLPKAGETVVGNSFLIYPGGKVANQAVALAKAVRYRRLCSGRWPREPLRSPEPVPSSPSEKHGWRVLGGMMGPVQ